VSQNLIKLQQQTHTTFNHNAHREKNTINTIQSKLRKHNATGTSADKGNSIVILPTASYNKKIQNFINGNKFRSTKSNQTKTFQNKIRTVINNSTHLINTYTRWKYMNLNPSAPTIKGLIKLHKPDQPVRPVVNWQNAPAYKLAKLFTQKTQSLAPLPYAFNIQSTSHLIQKLKQTRITPTTRFASLDISNIYSNFPVKETKLILEDILNHNSVDHHIKTELLNWYDAITQQNYFTHNNNIILQKDGLAMGSPSSSLIYCISK
jgi:hypothetical protein